MNIFQKLSLISKVRWTPLLRHHRMFIFRKASAYIHPTAKIEINKTFFMNKSHGQQRHALKGFFRLEKMPVSYATIC